MLSFIFQKAATGSNETNDKPVANLDDQWEMFEKLVGESAFLPDENTTSGADILNVEDKAVKPQTSVHSSESRLESKTFCLKCAINN